MTMHPPSVKMWDADALLFAEEVDAKFPRNDWTSTYNGHGDDGAAYAVDFMCNKSMGDKIAPYVWANRKRFGIWYVIWYGRIISMTRPNQGWLPYFDRNNPNPSKSHKNHVHASLYTWARFQPLVESKPVPVVNPVDAEDPGYPRPKYAVIYLDKLKANQQNSDSVWWVQVALNTVVGGNVLKLTGDYDIPTQAKAKAFQESLGDDPKYCDGILGRSQTFELVRRSKLNIKIEEES